MKLSKIFKRYNKILFSIMFFVLFFGVSFAGASQNGSAGEGGSSFSYILMSFVDLLGNIWFIFPMIAGKLLTNDFVYGSIFNLDVTLWNIWNFSRTLANFIIGFLFIYLIFKYTLSFSSKDASLLKTGLPKIVISSILVNMSWFLLGVLIDISTILIAAFGTMSANMDINTPQLILPKNIELTVQKCNPKENPACIRGMISTNVQKKNQLTLADLQTYETNISGPLMFLGTSILGITTTKDNLLNTAYDFQAKKFKHGGEAIKAIIKLFIFVMFIIPIIILIVVNIVRIFWLWMYIAFSPLLFLDWIWGKNKLAGANKAFAFKNAIGLIFSPALVVLGFSISIILILGVANALNTVDGDENNPYREKVKETFLLGESGNGILVVDFGKAQDTTKTASMYIGGFFGYLIISILLVIVIWGIMKLSFKASEVTSGIADKMFNFAEDLFKTIPVPTPLGKASIGSLQQVGRNIAAIPDNWISKQQQELDRMFNKTPDIENNKLNDLLKDLKNSTTFNTALSTALSEIEKFRGKREVETSPNIKKLIDTFVSAANKKGISIASQLNSARSYKEKVEIISQNESSIKRLLSNTDF